MTKRFEATVGIGFPQRAEPFHAGASVYFRWDPFESARTFTTEDDMISELFGRDDELPETMPRHLRTDFVLRASLPYDTYTMMPDPSTWGSWSRSVDDDMENDIALQLESLACGHRNALDAWMDSVAELRRDGAFRSRLA